MSRFQTCGNLPRDGEGFVERERAVEVGALHQFHHQGALLNAVHGGDIGVIQSGQQLGFALEASHVLSVVGERCGQHFDGYVAVELAVAGAVHFSHAACAEGRQDLVRAESIACRKRHRKRCT